MRAKFKRPSDFNTMGKKIERDIRNFLSVRLVVALQEFQKAIMETPVYTGRTIVNYQWTLGSPAQGIRGAIQRPRLPGKTSNLPIGEEPRRAANAAIPQREFEQITRSILSSKNPFQRIFLVNNVPNFSDVEYGAYGKDARTPAGGMTRRGEVQLQMIIKGITKL